MQVIGWIALGLFLLSWMGGAFHVVPIRLHNSYGRHYLKRQGRLYRGVYSLWVPVKEVIPNLLYVPSGQQFYLDDYGFNKGRK